jgi:hypothetical protein
MIAKEQHPKLPEGVRAKIKGLAGRLYINKKIQK